jgi:hypothetical protein
MTSWASFPFMHAAATSIPEAPTRGAAAGGQAKRAKAGAANTQDDSCARQLPQEASELNSDFRAELEEGSAGEEAAAQGLDSGHSEEQQQARHPSSQHDRLQLRQRQNTQLVEEQLEQQQQQLQSEGSQQHPQQAPLSLHPGSMHHTPAPADHHSEDSSSSSDLSESDLDLDDDGVVGQLAASIRQALSSRAGGPTGRSAHQDHKRQARHSQQQQQQQGPAAEASGPALPHWQPVTGLQLPVAAARAGLGAGEVVGGRLPQTVQGRKKRTDSLEGKGEAPLPAAVAVAGGQGLLGQGGSIAKSLYAPTLDPVKAGKAAKMVAPDTAGEEGQCS